MRVFALMLIVPCQIFISAPYNMQYLMSQQYQANYNTHEMDHVAYMTDYHASSEDAT